MAGIDTFDSPKAKAKTARILVELEKLPMTRDELQCLLGVSKACVQRYIVHLRSQPRQLYIARWKQGHGRSAPVYAVGTRRDAPKPAAMTRTERNAKEWKRIKADPDRHARVKAAARVHGTIQRVKAAPQPWFAALVGIASNMQKEAA